MAVFQFSGSRGFNEAGVVHAGEAACPRDRGPTCAGLQRGRRCSRRRGSRPAQARRAFPRFNEAGVVHAGEDLMLAPCREWDHASTRPALFTPERFEVFPGPSFACRLQRGRRCSRRRGEQYGAPIRRALQLQRGRRCSRRRGCEGGFPSGLLQVLQRGRRCSRRRGHRRPSRARCAALLQRGRRCSRRRGPLRDNGCYAQSGLQRGRRCSRRRGGWRS